MPRPIHFEIHADDMDRAQAFYETMFGWTFNMWGDGAYRLIATGEGPGIDGGMMRRHGPAPVGGEPINSWVCTVDVEDVDSYVAKAGASGGSGAAQNGGARGRLARLCQGQRGQYFGADAARQRRRLSCPPPDILSGFGR